MLSGARLNPHSESLLSEGPQRRSGSGTGSGRGGRRQGNLRLRNQRGERHAVATWQRTTGRVLAVSIPRLPPDTCSGIHTSPWYTGSSTWVHANSTTSSSWKCISGYTSSCTTGGPGYTTSCTFVYSDSATNSRWCTSGIHSSPCYTSSCTWVSSDCATSSRGCTSGVPRGDCSMDEIEESERASECVAAMECASRAILDAIEETSEHLEYWKSLQRSPPLQQLTTVLVRRGPLPFIQSLASLISTQTLSSYHSLLSLIPAGESPLHFLTRSGKAHLALLSKKLRLGGGPFIGSPGTPLDERSLSSHPISHSSHPTSHPSSYPAPNNEDLTSHTQHPNDSSLSLSLSQSQSQSQTQAQAQTPPGYSDSSSVNSSLLSLSLPGIGGRGSGRRRRSVHDQSEKYAAAFVAERVALLKILQERLLFALGKVWDSAAVPGSPPLLTLDTNQGHSLTPLLTSLPPSFNSSAALEQCTAALQGLRGLYHLPKEQHGPFSSNTTITTTAPQAHSGTTLNTLALNFSFDPDADRRGASNSNGQKDKAWEFNQVQLMGLQQCSKELKTFVSMLLVHYGRPSALSRRWVEYSLVGLGALMATSWVVKHRIDFKKWYTIAMDSSKTFVMEHVVQPLMVVRDDLFLTFRPERTSIVGMEEVESTAESLRRMLIAYVQLTAKDAKMLALPPGVAEKLQPNSKEVPSTGDLLPIMMSHYEREVMKPLQGVVSGHLAQALLIQLQRMKLHVESALLEMEKILRSNAINFAFLSALPALVLFLAGAGLIRDWLLSPSKGAQGRGRAAQTARRMLLGQLELLILRQMDDARKQFGNDETKTLQYGELIYALHRVHGITMREAQRTKEWESLRLDIAEASRSDLGFEAKALLVARMSRLYECFMIKPQRLL